MREGVKLEKDQLKLKEIRLEVELAQAKEAAANNEGAYVQLSTLLSKGKLKQDSKGQVYVPGSEDIGN